MKKLFAILLALVMVCSLGVTAFAEETTTAPAVGTESTASVVNGGSFTIDKEYNVTGTAPEETFTFTVTNGKVVDGDAESAPDVTIGSAHFDSITDTTETVKVTVKLPTYTKVGEYQYTISEENSSTAGVTTQAPLTLIVYVVNGENGLECRVALKDAKGNKVDGFTGTFANKYESGSLAVSKTVTGNMGDKTKEFEVTVSFTNTNGASVISYLVGTETETIEFINGVATANITLKDSATITFTNIPTGTTYEVTEDDYSKDGYATPDYNFSDTDKTISANDADTVVITNNKDGGDINTGVPLDSLPYVVVLAVALLGAVVLFTKKRVNE